MSNSKPAASGGGDARNALLDQIRVAGSNKSGLKSVSENTSRGTPTLIYVMFQLFFSRKYAKAVNQ